MRESIRGPIRRAAEIIRSADSLVAVGHVDPDGDALGSALALALAARSAGIDAVASFGGAFVVPESLSFLDQTPLVPADEVPSEPAVMVVFDAGVRKRIGELAVVADRAANVVVVDHHPSGDEDFGDVRVVDPAAGASAQLAFYLIRELGWSIDERVGTALLTGIVTDTGRFQYSSTDPAILRVAAELIESGVRPDIVGQHLFESAPFGYLRASAAVLGRSRLEPELRLVWSVVYRADLKAAEIGWEDCDGLIDDLRIAREADVAALLKEVEGGFKVSLRSRGRVDVGSIAAAHGGGGHHNAAGFTVAGAAETVIEMVRGHLR